MMSLVRAQFGEPSTAKAVLFVLHSACDALSIDDIMINSHALYHSVAFDDSEVVASKKQLITVFYEAKPPKARS